MRGEARTQEKRNGGIRGRIEKMGWRNGLNDEGQKRLKMKKKKTSKKFGRDEEGGRREGRSELSTRALPCLG